LANTALLKESESPLDSIPQDQIGNEKKRLPSLNDVSANRNPKSPLSNNPVTLMSPKERGKISNEKSELHSRKSTVESQDIFEKYLFLILEHAYFADLKMKHLLKSLWMHIIGKIVQF
jgi:hypothetical protein